MTFWKLKPNARVSIAAHQSMNKPGKIVGTLLLAVVLCVAGLIATVEFVSNRSRREVVTEVTQLAPGTPFSLALQRLGQPTQTFTNAEKIVWWVEKMGSHVEAHVATNSTLHTFVHRGPPFRYILVYTDRELRKVVYADWCQM